MFAFANKFVVVAKCILDSCLCSSLFGYVKVVDKVALAMTYKKSFTRYTMEVLYIFVKSIFFIFTDSLMIIIIEHLLTRISLTVHQSTVKVIKNINKRIKIMILTIQTFTFTQSHTGTSGSNAVVQIEVKKNLKHHV